MHPNPIENACPRKLWMVTWFNAIWDEIPFYYAGNGIDEFTVMPNHMHGIIIIVGETPCGCPVSTRCGCRSITGQTLENGRGPGYRRGKEQKFGQARGQGQPQGVAPTED